MPFYHPGKDIWLLVHGDEFLAVARQAGRDYTKQIFSDAYEIKADVAGPEPNEPKEIKILGHIVTPDGIQYQPDPGHIEKVIYELGLGESNGVATPGVRDETNVSAAELLERRRCCAKRGSRLIRRDTRRRGLAASLRRRVLATSL